MKLSNYIGILSNPTYGAKHAKNNDFIKLCHRFSS